MRNLIIAALAATSLGAAVTPALAQPLGGGGSINDRQDRIEQRIDQGERSGQLNRREVWRLRSELRDIERLEHRFRRSDGLDRRERAILERRLDALSASVFSDKHDWQRRRDR